MDYLKAACRFLNITPEQILGSSLETDALSLVVDYGVAGGKKLSLSLTTLAPFLEVETIEAAPVEVSPPTPRKRKR